jgi:hypothetical protein
MKYAKKIAVLLKKNGRFSSNLPFLMCYCGICQSYPRNAIKIPAATAEPITPETLDDMQ